MNKKNIYLLALLISAFSSNLFAQQLTTTGAMNKMGKTGFAPVIWLDTISNKSHLYALGPYEKLQGEITVVDGKPFYVTAYEEGKSKISQSWDIKSPFFVQANVANWQAFKLTSDISSVADIQAIVSKIARENGYDTSVPFPFKLEGVLEQATFHVVTPRSPDVIGYRENVKQQLFPFSDIKGQIIGFYSEKHQGVFTGSKSFIHVHFLKDDQTFMGHLDKIITSQSSLTLYLPAKNKSSKIRVNDTDFSKGRLGLQHDQNFTVIYAMGW